MEELEKRETETETTVRLVTLSKNTHSSFCLSVKSFLYPTFLWSEQLRRLFTVVGHGSVSRHKGALMLLKNNILILYCHMRLYVVLGFGYFYVVI